MSRGIPERGCIYLPGSSRGGVPDIFRPPGRSGVPPPPGCGGGRAAPHSMPFSGRQQQRQRRHDSRRSAASLLLQHAAKQRTTAAGSRRHDPQTGTAAARRKAAGRPAPRPGIWGKSAEPYRPHSALSFLNTFPYFPTTHTDNNRKRKKKGYIRSYLLYSFSNYMVVST